ncbi:hypothetical protein V1477_018207 [Vespula maculifrons]|uniref:Uncharacterized protein n=1 Tax=Vespula maculifrons TaxID=7453 RepID=A0ABD2AYT1_VESMC
MEDHYVNDFMGKTVNLYLITVPTKEFKCLIQIQLKDVLNRQKCRENLLTEIIHQTKLCSNRVGYLRSTFGFVLYLPLHLKSCVLYNEYLVFYLYTILLILNFLKYVEINHYVSVFSIFNHDPRGIKSLIERLYSTLLQRIV